MTATYIIDGYNLLHAMGVLSGRVGPGGLEKARQSLLGLLHVLGEQDLSFTVVFDASGARPGASAEAEYLGIRVLYALGKLEADDVIEEQVRAASAPKSLHVVSNDHRVQRAARRRHCVVHDCDDFLRWVDQQRQPRQPPAPGAPEKQEKLPAAEVQHWLAEFADLEKDPSLREVFQKYDFEDDDQDIV